MCSTSTFYTSAKRPTWINLASQLYHEYTYNLASTIYYSLLGLFFLGIELRVGKVEGKRWVSLGVRYISARTNVFKAFIAY